MAHSKGENGDTLKIVNEGGCVADVTTGAYASGQAAQERLVARAVAMAAGVAAGRQAAQHDQQGVLSYYKRYNRFEIALAKHEADFAGGHTSQHSGERVPKLIESAETTESKSESAESKGKSAEYKELLAEQVQLSAEKAELQNTVFKLQNKHIELDNKLQKERMKNMELQNKVQNKLIDMQTKLQSIAEMRQCAKLSGEGTDASSMTRMYFTR